MLLNQPRSPKVSSNQPALFEEIKNEAEQERREMELKSTLLYDVGASKSIDDLKSWVEPIERP